jgi:peptidoglycan hydrolase-like protein with peptidoglycan-binding domain
MKATHAMARPARIEQLQNALNANGATLTVDGKMGPKTKSALMDFQKAKGLKVTGRPDKETRDALKTTG